MIRNRLTQRQKDNAKMIKTTKYVRKPFIVEAVQVTTENLEAIRDWCEGTLEKDSRPYVRIRVVRALNDRQTKAYPGDWVLKAGTGFKVYTPKAFKNTFELLDGEVKDEACQAEKVQPPENWAQEPAEDEVIRAEVSE